MSEAREAILTFLQESGTDFGFIPHDEVHTIEDCIPNAARLGAIMPRNLFLTPRNESVFVLAIVPPLARFRTADISKQLGLSRLSFASPERVEQFLHTKPGAVSPLELIFDTGRQLRFAMDKALFREPVLAFHPGVPTATVSLKTVDFLRIVAGLGYTVEEIDTSVSEGANA